MESFPELALVDFGTALKNLRQYRSPGAEVHLGEDPGPLISTKTPMDINACVDVSRIRAETGFAPEYDPFRGVEHYLQ